MLVFFSFSLALAFRFVTFFEFVQFCCYSDSLIRRQLGFHNIIARLFHVFLVLNNFATTYVNVH